MPGSAQRTGLGIAEKAEMVIGESKMPSAGNGGGAMSISEDAEDFGGSGGGAMPISSVDERFT